VQLCIDRPIELPAKPLVNCSVLQTHSFDELAYCYYSLLRHIQAAYTSTQTTQTQTAKIHLNRPTAKIQQRKYKSKSIELRTLSHPTRNRATAAGPEHNTDARTHPDAPRPHQERSTVPVHQPRPQHPRPTDHCTGHPTSVGWPIQRSTGPKRREQGQQTNTKPAAYEAAQRTQHYIIRSHCTTPEQ